jgi:hypothetical protein
MKRDVRGILKPDHSGEDSLENPGRATWLKRRETVESLQ